MFSHGHLYIAISRVTSRDGLKMLTTDENVQDANVTSNVVYEGEKNHKKGGLNCVFGNFFFYVLDNCHQVQSLCAADNVKNRRRKNTINYTGSFHKPEVVLSSLHFQGEFH